MDNAVNAILDEIYEIRNSNGNHPWFETQQQIASFCASFCAAVLHFWVQMP